MTRQKTRREPAQSAQSAQSAQPAAFFDDDYHRVLEPFHPESEAREETAALRELLALSQDERVLDLGCGWGRHLSLLLQAGHDVTGLDLSLPLLRRVDAPGIAGAPDAGDATDTPVATPRSPLVAGDMLQIPFRAGSFDVVLNLATSLGLFLDDEPAVRALREARRVLRPRGKLLIEGMHRDDVVAGYAERDRWELEDGTEVRARRHFNALTGVSHEVLRWGRGPAGEGARRGPEERSRPRVKRHSLRLRTATEMTGLLQAADLTVHEAWGGWEGESFRSDSPRLILLASPRTLPGAPGEP